MSTTKKRINISITKEMDDILMDLAKRDQMPTATKAEHLLRFALELEEDEGLSRIADERSKEQVEYIKDSDEIWK